MSIVRFFFTNSRDGLFSHNSPFLSNRLNSAELRILIRGSASAKSLGVTALYGSIDAISRIPVQIIASACTVLCFAFRSL